MEAERLRRAFGSKYGSKKYNKQDDDNMNDKPRNNPFKDVARKRNNKLFTFGDDGDEINLAEVICSKNKNVLKL